MRVNDLAKKAGVTTDTSRYYTHIRLLNPSKDACNGYKNYHPQDERRLKFALKARHLGFTISEIQEIITLSSTGSLPVVRSEK